tara:strand:+ start:471 stop:1094 length:624 start_codon:yes stop_codon:yes gene_type:complete
MNNFLLFKILNSKKPKKNGFSLIELVIVVAVLAILSAIAIPSFKSIILKSRQAAGASYVDAVLKSASIHYVEEGRWPTNWSEVERYSGGGFSPGNPAVCSIGYQAWCNGTERLVINGQYMVTFYTNTYAHSQGNYPNDAANSMFGISLNRVDHTGPTKDNYSVIGCTTRSNGGRMYLFPPNEFYAGWPWWGDMFDKEGNKLWLCGNP